MTTFFFYASITFVTILIVVSYNLYKNIKKEKQNKKKKFDYRFKEYEGRDQFGEMTEADLRKHVHQDDFKTKTK